MKNTRRRRSGISQVLIEIRSKLSDDLIYTKEKDEGSYIPEGKGKFDNEK